MTDLSSLPEVIERAFQIEEGDKDSAETLASAIGSDHHLSLQLLRISNSPFYGKSEHVESITDAVMLIGFNAVRSLAVAAAAVSGVWSNHELFDARRFWFHSLSCGLFAEMTARRMRMNKPEAMFALGVLHDIGRVIMIQYIPDAYGEAVKLMNEKRIYLWRAEREVLGFDHAEAGERLAKRWRLPQLLSQSIRFHHEPQEAPAGDEYSHVLALANALSHSAFSADFEGRIYQPLYRDLWIPLGLDEPSVRSILANKRQIEERTSAFYETAVRRDGAGLHGQNPS